MAFPLLIIRNLIQRGENLSLEGEGGDGPRLVILPQTSVEIKVNLIQFDALFLNTLALYVERGKAAAWIDSTALTPQTIRELSHRDLSEITGATAPHQLVGVDHVVAGLTPGDVLQALTPTTFGFMSPGILSEAFVLSAGRNVNITNSYLRGIGNVPTNLSGYVLPFDATLIGIGVTTSGLETWVAEIRKNGGGAVIASLSLIALRKASTLINVDVNANDEIQMYCNGIDINSPQMVVYLKRR